MTAEQEQAIKIQQTAKQVSDHLINTRGNKYPDVMTLISQIVAVCDGSELLATPESTDKLICAVLMHTYEHTADRLNDKSHRGNN